MHNNPQIQDAIFVCLNFYATVSRKKKKKKKKKKKPLAVRQLQGMLRIAVRRFLLLTIAPESAAKCSEALALWSHLRAVGGCYKKGFSRHYENKYERDLKLVGRIFCDGTSVGCQVAT